MKLVPDFTNLRHRISTALKMGNTPISMEQAKKSGRLSGLVVPRRSYKVDMELNNWRTAVETARNWPYYNRTSLYTLYQQALEDSHLLSQLNTAKHEVVSEGFAIVDRITGEVDEELTDLLRRPWFDKYVRYVLDAEFWGHSLIEFQQLVASNRGRINQEFADVKLIPRLYVKPHNGHIVKEPNMHEGLCYREEPWQKWLIEVGDSEDLGLLYIATKEVIWKNYSRSDWSRSSEKFGMPYLVIRTDTTEQTELDKRAEMGANFGANGWAVVDKEDDINLLEQGKTDAYKVYQEFIKYADEQNSKGVNGQTGSTDVKAFAGSAEVHERVMNTYTKARMRRVAYNINYQLIPFLIGHGYPFDIKTQEFVYLGLMDSDDEDGGDNINTDQDEDNEATLRRGGGKKRQRRYGLMRPR